MSEVSSGESLDRLLAIFDVAPADAAPADAGLTRFVGTSESRGRNVVEGSQLLGQAMVAAAKALPGRAVRRKVIRDGNYSGTAFE